MQKLRPFLKQMIKPAVAIAAAFLIGALLLVLAGYDVGLSFRALWDATFSSLRNFTVSLNRSSPLIFTGLAVAIAFRGSVFNIGAEGQLLVGAIGATLTGLYLSMLPGIILIPLMILSGALFGAAWAFIPGLLKARYGVSEVITTIMFNYIGLQLVGYLVRGPIRDVSQAEPQSYPIALQAWLPNLIPGTRLHFGYFLGVLIAVGLFFLLFKTYTGYEVRAVGLNQDASRTAGISVEKTMVGTMLLSGALAGIGGAIEVGNLHYLIEGISPGHGFTGIAVSVLASNNPLGIIFTSFLFGALSSGAMTMQRTAGVSANFVQVFQGIMIVGIAVATVQQKKKAVVKKIVKKEGVV